MPRPVSERISITSVRRHLAPLMRYSPSPARFSRRSDRDLAHGQVQPPEALSSTTSTSASERDLTPCAPAKITSCIDWPRTATGDCSPSAHSTASVMFDLPEPFGPTITDTPGENVSRVRSGNDLKPRRVIELRCMAIATGPRDSSAASAAACSASFFERPLPACQRLAVDHRRDLEGPLVWRALLGATSYVHDRRRAAPAAPAAPLKSAGCASARSISGGNASTTASATCS